MIHTLLRKAVACCTIAVALGTAAFAQSPGMIVKRATGAGLSILDPNNDGYTSVTNQGFKISDSDTSKTEIKFRPIKPIFYEPTGDLMRGPTGGFSDLVTATDSTGSFVYSDGTNLIFRQRIGNFIPGSKSYSILVDTDGKFGYSGASADPGYTAPGNGKIGNPGFEFEICFQSNFRVAVYNVDTANKVVLKYANTPVTNYSQVSVALSYVSGNPDYFMDFYVPMSQLGVNSNTSLRFASTTVMSPLPALDGPISDIFGYGSISDYMDAFIKVIKYSTPVTPATLLTSSYVPVCTEAPSVNAPTVGSTTVSGTWTRLDGSKSNTAKIYLYRNGAFLDSSTVATSGAGWSVAVPAVTAGTTFYARAKATGEGNCFQSGTVTAIKCSGSTSARVTVSCSTAKGMDGSYLVSGSRVRIYQNVVPGNSGVASFTLFADSAVAPANFASVTSPFVLQDNATKVWKCDGTDGNGNPGTIGNSACTGGSTNDMPANASLAITVQESGKCESMPRFVCPNGTTTATPTITSTLYPGNPLSGTTVANGYVRLYVDSVLRGAVYADASGNYSFSSPGLATGNKVEVFAQSSSTTCVSASVTGTVSAYTTPPSISTDNQGYITPGTTTISGTSSEVNNTILYLYKRVGTTVTFLGQTTITNGIWTISGITSAAAGDTYLTVQQNPLGMMSDTSNLAYVPSATTTSCPTFSSATYPANTTSVSGTVSPALTNGTVYLYIDGAKADSATSVTTSFTINVNSTTYNKIYAGATISVTAKTSGGGEKTNCSNTTATITCSTITTPTFTLNPSSIYKNGTTTVNVSSATTGLLYSLIGSPDNGTAYANAVEATSSSFSMTSYAFNTSGTYPLTVRALNLGEGGTCSVTAPSSNLNVSTIPLPIRLEYFRGYSKAGIANLDWSAFEDHTLVKYVVERSEDARSFVKIGEVAATGSGTRKYVFTDAYEITGTAWYRLALIETTGNSSYSPIIQVNHNSHAGDIAAKPNPFISSISVDVTANDPSRIELSLIDITGRVTAVRSYEVPVGPNVLVLSDLQHLNPGIYILEVRKGGQRTSVQRVEKI